MADLYKLGQGQNKPLHSSAECESGLYAPFQRNESPSRKRRAGFAVAPILYLLTLAGVAGGVLFSGYSQILRANVNATNANIVKNDLSGALTTLAATAELSADQSLFCPPGSSSLSADCSAPVKLVAFGDLGAEASKLPNSYASAGTTGAPYEVGVFAAGAGVKQLDPWGHFYIYCRWENARANSADPAMALISAGANAVLETKCGDATPKGDDQIQLVSVGAAIQRAAVWQDTGTSVEYGQTGTKVTVSDEGVITATGLIVGTATFTSLDLTAPLPITSGGTGAANIATARSNLGSGVTGDALFLAATTTAARNVLGATSYGHYLLSSAGLVADTASAVRLDLLGAGVIGNEVFVAPTAQDARTTLGATNMGHYLFSSSTLDATLAGNVRVNLLGAGAVGESVFVAGTTDAAQTALGATAVGKAVFMATDAAAGRTALGGGAVGSPLFTAGDQATAWSILGLTGSGGTLNVDITGEAGSVDGANITGTVPIAHGGTGGTSASAALDNLFGGDSTATATLNVDRLAGNSIDSSKLTNVVTAGTYNQVEVDSAGRVISGASVPIYQDRITDGVGDSVLVTSDDGGKILFSTASAVRMVIDAIGNVGIGIDEPLEKLHIFGGNARISGPSDGYRELQFATSTAQKRWVVAADDSTETGFGNTGSDFVIRRYTDAGAAADTMTIDRATGDVLFSGGVASSTGFLGYFTGTFDGTFIGTVGSNISLGPDASDTNPRRSGDATTGFFSPAAGTVSIATGGTERVRVGSDGAVTFGAGAATPGTILDMSSATNSMLLPQGTEAQRPAGVEGMVRYNTTSHAFEIYQGSAPAWFSMSAVSTAGSTSYLGGAPTTASPSRSDDLTTGLFSDTASTVGVTISGTQRLLVTSTGVRTEGLLSSANLALGSTSLTAGSTLDMSAVTNSLIVPKGTAAQRPAGVTGMLRYNTDTAAFEVYQGSTPSWFSLGAVSTSGSTQYLGADATHTSPSRSDDITTGLFSDTASTVKVATSGVERLAVTETGINVNGNLSLLTATGRINIGGSTVLRQPQGDITSIGIGLASLDNQTTGSGSNIAIGFRSLRLMSTGTYNVALGGYAMVNAFDAKMNVAVGYAAGGGLSSGTNNSIFGFNVGRTTLSTGSHNILIGTSSAVDTPLSSTSNWLNIGNTIYGDLSLGAVAIGAPAVTTGAALDMSGKTNAMIVPKGTEAQRPAGVVGMVRYNNDSNSLEVYQGSTPAWVTLGAGATAGSSMYLGADATHTSPSRSDDVTTGLFSDTASTIAISTAGTERLRVTASGSVGIGTSSPGAMLELYGTATKIKLSYDATRAATVSVDEFGQLGLASKSGMSVVVKSPLRVASNTIHFNGTDANTKTVLSMSANDTYLRSAGAVAAPTSIIFQTATGGNTANVESMRLTGSGSLGIGTSTPSQALDVTGNINVSTATGAYYIGNVKFMHQPAGDTTSVGIGQSTLAAQTETWLMNVALGGGALRSTTTGNYNVAVGNQSLMSNETGAGNVAIGIASASNATSGDMNTVIGGYAGNMLSTGSYNLFAGLAAGAGITSGIRNVVLGLEVASTTLSTGSNNILIGTSSAVDTPAADTSNWLNIGNTIYGDLSTGSVAIGAAAVTTGAALDMSGKTNAMIVPKGTEAQRPAGVVGMVRYNNDSNSLEVYQGSTPAWVTLGASGSGSSTNYLGADATHTSPSRSDDVTTGLFSDTASTVKIATSGTERLSVTTTGVDVSGNLNLASLTNYLSIAATKVLKLPAGDVTSVAIGGNALASQTATGAANIALGVNALQNTTTGYSNVGIGPVALYQNTGGYKNIAIGSGSMAYGQNGAYNIAMGDESLRGNGVATKSYNVALGYRTLYSTVTADHNIAIGYASLYQTTTGSNNIAFGRESGYSLTTGTNNLIVGYQVGRTTLSTGSSNILIGNSSAVDTPAAATSNYLNIGNAIKLDMTSVTATNPIISMGPMLDNTSIAVGLNTLQAQLATNLSNTALGYQSLSSTTTGYENTGVGRQALKANTTGTWNTSVGSYSLAANTTGGLNTAVGVNSLKINTTGFENVAVGMKASEANTIGVYNTAVGTYALQNTGTGGSNTAVGRTALTSNRGGSYNSALGVRSLDGANSSGNSAVGESSLRYTVTGGNNTALGRSSGSANLTGSNNLYLGYFVGSTTLSSGSNNILIGTSSAVDTPLSSTSNWLNIGNTIYGDLSTGSVAIGAAAVTTGAALDMSGKTNAMIVPKGTEAQRPTGVVGMVRYNNDSNSLEVYQGSTPAWVTLGAGATAGSSMYLGADATHTSPSRSDDVTTGLFSDTASTVSISTAGTERLRITATGSVGIGTSAPDSPLYVAGAVSPDCGSDQNVATFSNTTGHYGLYFRSSNDCNGHNRPKIYVASIGATSKPNLNIIASEGHDGADVIESSPAVLIQAGVAETNNYANRNLFGIANATGTAFFVVGATGKVGIGTTTPAQALDVNGNINVSTATGAYYIGNVKFMHQPVGDTTSVGVGPSTLAAQTATERHNIALGYKALQANTTGRTNIAIGTEDTWSYAALGTNKTGGYNIAIGEASLARADGLDGNIALGYQSLWTLSGGYGGNVMIGTQAAYAAGSLTSSVGIGSEVMAAGGGTANVALGASAMYHQRGDSNVAIGANAMRGGDNYYYVYPVGGSNTVIGRNAYYNVADPGMNNTILGAYVASTTLTTGSSNILIGTSSAVDTPAADTSNWLNIGNTIYGDLSTGSVAIGAAAVTTGAALDMSGKTNAMIVPKGTEAQRPAGVVGMVRYNNDSNSLEVYQGSTPAWVSLGASASGSSTTYLGASATLTSPSRSDDVTTGLFSATASTVSISTAGTERLRVTATGSVGIGTNAPDAMLHVSASSDNLLRISRGNARRVFFDDYSGGAILYMYDGAQVNRVKIDAQGGGSYLSQGGLVINSATAPVQALDVYGNINVSTATGAYYIGNVKFMHQPVGDTTSVGLGPSTLAAQTATGLSNTAVGYQALLNEISGQSNTAIGAGALRAAATSVENTAVGASAGRTLLGNGNSIFGTGAMYNAVAAKNNTVLGNQAGYILLSGQHNTIIGYNVADAVLTTGTGNILVGTSGAVTTPAADTSNYLNIGNAIKLDMTSVTATNPIISMGGASLDNTSIGVGLNALQAQTATNLYNTALGYLALSAVTTGKYHSAVGYQALGATITGQRNIAVGNQALKTNNGNGNIAIGYQVLWGNALGGFNTAVGDQTMLLTTTGDENVALGAAALRRINGSYNTAIGNSALRTADASQGNVAIGYWAGYLLSSGGNNTILGTKVASTTLTTGSNNILIGTSSLVTTPAAATSNYLNIGNAIKLDMTSVTATNPIISMGGASLDNTSIGVGLNALQAQTGTSRYNTGIGASSLSKITSGDVNVSVGAASLPNGTTSRHNVAIGGYTLGTTTTGSENTAIGAYALQYNNATGNVAVGKRAGQYSSGSLTAAVGFQALGGASGAYMTGTANAALGGYAGASVSSGSSNLIAGPYVASTTLTTGSNNILIGTSSAVDTPAADTSNWLNIGNTIYGDLSTGSVAIGAAAVTTGVSLDMSARTNSIIVPKGTDAQRPVGVTGMIRYNTTTNAVEVYQGASPAWLSLGAVTTAGSTNFLGANATNTSPSRSDDATTGFFSDAAATVKTAIAGVERLSVTATGLHVNGNINVNAISNYYAIAGKKILHQPNEQVTSIAIGSDILALQTGTNVGNSAVGFEALYSLTVSDWGGEAAGSYNSVLGYQALRTATFVGNGAGSNNVAIGKESLSINVTQGSYTGSKNVAVGLQAMNQLTAYGGGTQNNAIGFRALYSTTVSGVDAGSENNAMGRGTLYSNTATGSSAGSSNNAIGYQALSSNTASGNVAGSHNSAIGRRALYRNTGVGDYAGSYNNVMGYYALYNNTGAGNTVIGSYALGRTTGTYTGSYNVALGYGVGSTTLVSGSNNILIGTSSLVDTPAADTSNWLNIGNTIYGDLSTGSVSIGAPAVTTGVSLDMSARTNSMIVPKGTSAQRPAGVEGMIRYNTNNQSVEVYQGASWLSLGMTSTAGSNQYLGADATHTSPSRSDDVTTGLFSDVAATVKTAIAGVERLAVTATGLNLSNATSGYAINNVNILHHVGTDTTSVGIGPQSLQTMTGTGLYNYAFGYQALQTNAAARGEAGRYNSAIGYQALQTNTATGNRAGASNTALGRQALQINTASGNYAGSYNNVLGPFSLWTNITSGDYAGSYNNALGSGSLYTNTASGGYAASYNNAMGASALYTNTTNGNYAGSYNNAVGIGSLYSNTASGTWAGSGNNAIGRYSFYINTASGIGAGSYNNVIGNYALQRNTGIGDYAGSYNNVMGHYALYKNSGAGNTVIGSYALGSTTATYTGSYNVALGYGVGSTTLVSGSSNILIGTSSAVDTPAADTSNWLNIGNTIYGNLSTGAIALGAAAVTTGVALDMSGKTNSMIVPKGTDAQRPTGVEGMVRYNTTSKALEIYQGTTPAWFSLSSASTAGSDTYLGTSASLTSPRRSDDATTGLFSPAADTVAISTGATERLRVTSLGRVGIGTTSPTYQFDNVATDETTSGTYALGRNNLTVTPTAASSGVDYAQYNVITSASPYNITGSLRSGANLLTYSGTGTLTDGYGSFNQSGNAGTGTITSLYGSYNYGVNNTTGTVGTIYGMYGYGHNVSTGPVTSIYGSYSYARNASTGTVTNLYGANIATANSTAGGTVTNARGLNISFTNNGTITTGYGIYLGTVYGTTNYGLYQAAAANDNYFAGNVGIKNASPAYPLQVGTDSTNGNGAYVSIAGVWTSISDARVKENVRPIKYGLNDLMKLKPVNYEMKDSHEKQIGLIAQDVMKVVPEVVSGSEKTRYGLSYDNLVALTVKSIQELKVANDNQSEKVAALVEENKKLRAELLKLKKTKPVSAVESEEVADIQVNAAYADLPEKTEGETAEDETRGLLLLVIKIGAGLGGLLVIGLAGCGYALYRMRRQEKQKPSRKAPTRSKKAS